MTARAPETETVAGLRPFFVSLFVPSAIFGLGTGARAPMMALFARTPDAARVERLGRALAVLIDEITAQVAG